MILPLLPPSSPQSAPPPSSTFWSVISSDASPTYAFPLPFVAHAWSKIVGAHPLVVLVGSEFSRHTSSSWISVLLTQLRSLSIKYITIDPTPSSPATFSQLVRLFAFKLPDILPHDYVVASDRCSVKFCLAMNGRISQCSQRYSAFAAQNMAGRSEPESTCTLVHCVAFAALMSATGPFSQCVLLLSTAASRRREK
jgi:hypothetical protein